MGGLPRGRGLTGTVELERGLAERGRLAGRGRLARRKQGMRGMYIKFASQRRINIRCAVHCRTPHTTGMSLEQEHAFARRHIPHARRLVLTAGDHP